MKDKYSLFSIAPEPSSSASTMSEMHPSRSRFGLAVELDAGLSLSTPVSVPVGARVVGATFVGEMVGALVGSSTNKSESDDGGGDTGDAVGGMSRIAAD